jgi:hypothetical protein
MGDNRLNILTEARRVLEEQGGTPAEREYLLKLLDLLTASIERYTLLEPENLQQMAQSLVDNRAFLPCSNNRVMNSTRSRN